MSTALNKVPQTSIIYGDSGASKTTQLYYFAKWFWRNYQKRIRLISCSGGGWLPFEDSGMIDEGIVDAIDLSVLLQGAETTRLALIRRLGAGFWPIVDPKGLGNCANGQYFFKAVDSCNTIEQDNIGCYMFEDMASLGKLLLMHLSEKEEGTGFKHSYKIEEDDLSIGGLQEGHYGLVQKEIHKLVQYGFKTLPIDYFLMTSLVGEGVNKRDRTRLYAPQVAGSASTPEVPSWFGNCFFLREMPILLEEEIDGVVTRTASSQRVLHFRDWAEGEDTIPHKAKVRIMPELWPRLLDKYPEGYVELTPEKGITPFLNFLERLKREQKTLLANAAAEAK